MTILSLQTQSLTRTNIYNTMAAKLHEGNNVLFQVQICTKYRETPTLDLTFNPGHKSLARVTLTFMLFLMQTAIVYEEW